LLRPGRFDYKIEIRKPDAAGCLRILEIATRNMPIEPGFELGELVPELLGSSGADIVFVAKEAAIGALRRSIDVERLIQNPGDAGFRLEEVVVGRGDFVRALEELQAGKKGVSPSRAARL